MAASNDHYHSAKNAVRIAPILFSAPMMRALLDGRKTQTRRVLKQQANDPLIGGGVCDPIAFPERPYIWLNGFDGTIVNPIINPPSVLPGDRLYVREAWHAARCLDSTPPRDIPHDTDIEYAATARSYAEIGLKGKFRQGMHMPRWASRITLIVTDIRIHALQEINEEDSEAEGWPPESERAKTGIAEIKDAYPIGWFAHLWDSINGKRQGCSWDSNPWVVAYSFDVIKQNVDQMAGGVA